MHCGYGPSKRRIGILRIHCCCILFANVLMRTVWKLRREHIVVVVAVAVAVAVVVFVTGILSYRLEVLFHAQKLLYLLSTLSWLVLERAMLFRKVFLLLWPKW